MRAVPRSRFGLRRLLSPLVAAMAMAMAACSSDPGPAGESTAAGESAAAATDTDSGDGNEEETAIPSGLLLSDDEEAVAANRRLISASVRPDVEIPTTWPSDIEELYGRYWLYWEAFAAAFGPPAVDPEFGPLEELSSPANWESLREQLAGFESDQVVLVLPEPSASEHLLHLAGAAVLDKAEGDEVVIQDCWIDDFVQVTTDGEVIGEADTATLMNVSMKVVDGEWRVNGISQSSAETEGYDQCASYAS